MRISPSLVLLLLFAAGCTPDIPVEPAFGVSAHNAVGPIPPEFAAFNRYDPRINPLLAEQMCTTPYDVQVIKALDAVPGEISAMQAECRRYQPWFAKLDGRQPTQ
jgi:hypothetical protein